MNPVDEEGKARSPEKMTELVHDAHQANTKKALKGLKVCSFTPSVKCCFTCVEMSVVPHVQMDAVLSLPPCSSQFLASANLYGYGHRMTCMKHEQTSYQMKSSDLLVFMLTCRCISSVHLALTASSGAECSVGFN